MGAGEELTVTSKGHSTFHPDARAGPGGEADLLSLLLREQGATYRDFFEACRLLEPALVSHLAHLSMRSEREVLRSLSEEAAGRAERRDLPAFAHSAAAIHRTIIGGTGCGLWTMLSSLFHPLLSEFYLWGAKSVDDPTSLNRAGQSYRKLVRLLESGDAKAAQVHWQRHFEHVRDLLCGDQFDQPMRY